MSERKRRLAPDRHEASPSHASAVAHDTIAAIATAPGRSAVALVRLSGPAALEIAARCITPWPLEAREASVVSVRDPASGELADRGVATVFRAPRSFTGEDTVEVSTHGGAHAPSRVLAALMRAGARHATAGEFTRRALLNGKLDLLQVEAIADLIDAPSRQIHRAALDQLSGTLTTRIAALRDAVLELEALLAYDIDFPDEDDGPVARDRVSAAAERALNELDLLLGTLPAARLAREGAVVVIAGVPNTGKSSLFNALLGETRAIVTEHAGTTRDAIDALIEADPYPLRLVDTAGLRRVDDPIERLGVEVSERWLARADVVLLCGTSAGEREVAARAVSSASSTPVLRVQTMADRHGAAPDAAVAVSAVSGEGLPQLRQAIADLLRARHPLPVDAPLILQTRHETALARAREELMQFQALWASGAAPAVVAAVHTRSAVLALDEMIGAVSVDDVLARVFERFCVGK